MPEQIRVRIKNGDAEVEVQAPPALVEQLLERWWSAQHTPSARDSGDAGRPKKGSRRRAKNVSNQDHDGPEGGNGQDTFKPQDLVNRIKEDDRWAFFEEKILHPKDRLAKVKLVCFFAKRDLTTGEIKSVLDGLGDKIDLPGVSNTIKKNRAFFKQDIARKRGTRVRYGLVGRAQSEFVRFLDDGH